MLEKTILNANKKGLEIDVTVNETYLTDLAFMNKLFLSFPVQSNLLIDYFDKMIACPNVKCLT